VLYGGPWHREVFKDPERWWEPPQVRWVQNMPAMSSAEYTEWRALIEIVEPFEQKQAEG